MKLTIKTLQQFTFKLDIDDTKSVKELKEQIEHDHGKDYPIAHQKLIYNGKILADESKLAEYDIDEKKFVVLMITRPPPPKQQPVEKSSTTPTKKDEANKQKLKPDDKRQQPKPTTGSTTTTTTTSSTTTSKPSSSSSSVASAAATTTPATPSNQAPTTPANLSTATTTTTTSSLQNAQRGSMPTAGRPAVPSAGSEQSYMSSRLASIMNQPQFRHLQELIQQSPHLISPTIDGLASSDPEMYSFITENPDIFISALNQPPLSLNLSPSSQSSTTGSAGGQQQQSDQGMRELQQGVRNLARQQVETTINVSERDREAIERLKELGFTEIQAYQAYIACDRDEQLAANLLFQMEQ